MIRFVCECGKQLEARAEDAGHLVRCPACNRQRTVPAERPPSVAVQTEEPAAPAVVSEDVQQYRPMLRDEPVQEEGRKVKDHPPPQPVGSSGKAIASLVLGILSLFCNVFAGLPALLLGILALRDIGRGKGRLSGQGLAIAGIVSACVGSLLSGVLLPVLLLPAIQNVREAAARAEHEAQSENNLKQMGLALQKYNSARGRLPRPDGHVWGMMIDSKGFTGNWPFHPASGDLDDLAGGGYLNDPALPVFVARPVGLLASPQGCGPFLALSALSARETDDPPRGEEAVVRLLPYVESAPVNKPPAEAGAPNKHGLVPLPRLSWRVAILPFLGEDELYSQFRHDEPWDSPHNRPLLYRMPKVYNCPAVQTRPGHTIYQVFVGKGAAFEPIRATRIPADFPDGTSNTLLIVEAARAVPWTKPEDLPFEPKKPIKPLLGSHYRGGFLVLTADGSSRLLTPGISENTLKAAITRNAHDALGPDW